MESLTDIANRLNRLEKDEFNNPKYLSNSKRYEINKYKIALGENLYDGKGNLLGQLADVHNDAIFIKQNDKIIKVSKSDQAYSKIDNLPF